MIPADFDDRYLPDEPDYIDAAEELPADEYEAYMRNGGQRWAVVRHV